MKSLVIPLLEYCGQLWNPGKVKDLQAIEGIRWTFTYKITEAQHLHYWERLHELKLYSPETTWTLYNYIYLEDNTAYAKCLWCNEAENRNQETSKTWNTACYYVSNKQNPCTILSRKFNAVILFGPRLHTSLPKYLRDIESLKTEKLKFELDKFLELIPDEPKMPNYATAARSISILDQQSHLRAQGIYQGSRVPDSATEQA